MNKKTVFLIVTVIGLAALAAGLGVLIWWLVDARYLFEVIELEGPGLGDVKYQAAFTRIKREGDMFWWFYPTLAENPTNRPIILWLDGVTGIPPSLLAHFAMFGPYDFNLNIRNDSWVNEYNLIFVDAPLGTGFSTALNDDNIPENLDENTEHLLFTLESFYGLNEEYKDTPLYICGQGHGAQMALSLALKMMEDDIDDRFEHNLKGVLIGNGIISPSLALTKLGFYLFEMGYVDFNGRAAIEEFSEQSNELTDGGYYDEAFDHFLTLEEFLNEKAGTVAVNLRRITDKLEIEATSTSTIDCGLRKYLRSVLGDDMDFDQFMVETVAPALGISTSSYDTQREAAIRAIRSKFMVPAVGLVEAILQSTNLSVSIYNGNLDAISTTPGQLEWVNNLEWSGQEQFESTPRSTLIVNNLVEGYFRVTDRLKFFWMNAAGEAVPLDNPVAMKTVIQLITNEE